MSGKLTIASILAQILCLLCYQAQQELQVECSRKISVKIHISHIGLRQLPTLIKTGIKVNIIAATAYRLIHPLFGCSVAVIALLG